MATVEFLQKRVDGKEKELERLKKKMVRIIRAEQSGWENNPYYYGERDKRITGKEIEEAGIALDHYREELRKAQEKAESRNVKAILDFLDKWKTRVREFHITSVPAFLEARKQYYKMDKEYCEWWNYGGRREASKEEQQSRRNEIKQAEKEYRACWSWLMPYMEGDTLNTDKLDKDLQNEADAKYDDIIERTCEIVGKITDAAGLKIGGKGDLNGFIIGTEGKASVKTIGAGGYNIQCFHFRTLIRKA